ncbi:hypothetical protein D3C87_2087220 [compost metagenome]
MSKSGLGEAGGLTDLLDVQGVNGELARGLAFTTNDLVHLLDAFHQLVEKFAHDGYLHVSMMRLSAFR